jgi:hypothetical protein
MVRSILPSFPSPSRKPILTAIYLIPVIRLLDWVTPVMSASSVTAFEGTRG